MVLGGIKSNATNVAEQFVESLEVIRTIAAVTGPIGKKVSMTADLLTEFIYYTSTKPEEDPLEKLANQMVEYMMFQVVDQNIKDNIANTVNEINIIRSQIRNYQEDEKSRFPGSRTARMLFDEISSLADSFDTQWAKLRPSTLLSSKVNLKRVQDSWEVYKILAVESLLIHQEEVLMDAFMVATEFSDSFKAGEETSKCDAILESADITNKAIEYKNFFVQERKKLIDTRTNLNSLQFETEVRFSGFIAGCQCMLFNCENCYTNKYTVITAVKDNIRGFKFKGSTQMSNFRNMLKAELEFDMRNASYNLDDVLEILDSFTDDTLYLCVNMLKDSAVRENFLS